MHSLTSDLPVLGTILDLIDPRQGFDFALLIRENADGDFVLDLEEALCQQTE